MTVHAVAQEGFSAGAEAYERARPGYPPEVVDWLAENLRLTADASAIDLAAGTGKLTSLLLPHCAAMIAMEPVAAMRSMLRAVLPDADVVAGAAEALPIRSGALDAVTVAQAFHWSDADAAFTELARVLRRRGRVALVWNSRDRSRPWVDAVWSIMDRVEKRAPWRDHESWHESALGPRPGFGPLHAATFHHEHVLTSADVVQRIASVSHVAVLPPAERDAVLAEVRAVLATDRETAGRHEVAIPYRVDAYWCERT